MLYDVSRLCEGVLDLNMTQGYFLVQITERHVIVILGHHLLR